MTAARIMTTWYVLCVVTLILIFAGCIGPAQIELSSGVVVLAEDGADVDRGRLEDSISIIEQELRRLHPKRARWLVDNYGSIALEAKASSRVTCGGNPDSYGCAHWAKVIEYPTLIGCPEHNLAHEFAHIVLFPTKHDGDVDHATGLFCNDDGDDCFEEVAETRIDKEVCAHGE